MLSCNWSPCCCFFHGSSLALKTITRQYIFYSPFLLQYLLFLVSQSCFLCPVRVVFPPSLSCSVVFPGSSCPQVVSQRFPQNSIGAVGSAMFLRFVNPAIVSPYEAGILDKKPQPRIERGLKLMSKVRNGIWVLLSTFRVKGQYDIFCLCTSNQHMIQYALYYLPCLLLCQRNETL